MPRKDSLYPLDWLRIADKDLRRVEYLLDVQDAEAAGFYIFNKALKNSLKLIYYPRDGNLNEFTTWNPC